jgi:3'-5' exoribonuclease
LLEHTAQMMRAAAALRAAYPGLHWDLVEAGVLFHDCGKMSENGYGATGFVSPYTLAGELLGHVTIGVEIINRLWRSLDAGLTGGPGDDEVRLHILHLIASHHGEKEFGAPVTPRTPEAWALHYIDNLDAKIEMLKMAYAEKAMLGPGIYEPRRPLEGRPVAPLASA